MLSPCPACHDTKRVHELRQDADGRPYRAAASRPCLLCTTPAPFVRRSPQPRITATYQYFVAGERTRGYEDEEYCDGARELRALVDAELMFADTVFHGARRWRDPVAGSRVDLRFTRYRDGAAIPITICVAFHRRRLAWAERLGDLAAGERVYLLGPGRYGTVERHHHRTVTARPDGERRACHVPRRALMRLAA